MGQYCNRRTPQSQRALSCPPKCEFELTKDAPGVPRMFDSKVSNPAKRKKKTGRIELGAARGINRDQLPLQAKHCTKCKCSILFFVAARMHERSIKLGGILASLISTAFTVSWKRHIDSIRSAVNFKIYLLKDLCFQTKSGGEFSHLKHLKYP